MVSRIVRTLGVYVAEFSTCVLLRNPDDASKHFDKTMRDFLSFVDELKIYLNE